MFTRWPSWVPSLKATNHSSLSNGSSGTPAKLSLSFARLLPGMQMDVLDMGNAMPVRKAKEQQT
jgi:hypothetical protein